VPGAATTELLEVVGWLTDAEFLQVWRALQGTGGHPAAGSAAILRPVLA